MIKVLLVDDNRGRGALIEQALIDSSEQYDVLRPESGYNLIRLVESFQPDVIIIEVDAPSRDTLEHLAIINEYNPKPVVVFAEDNDRQLIGKAIRSGVSAYVVDGLSHHRVIDILEVAIARFREYQALKTELTQAKSQLVERKTIEKAKGLIMQQKNITEDEAYKTLRKMAMDKGMPLSEVANQVITVFEMLS